jgi:hypothetical protein
VIVANENSLRAAASDYFKSLGPSCFFEKRWGGALFQRRGVSDYTGIAWGIPFAIELKHPDKEPVLEPDQAAYQEKVRDAGGLTLVTNKLQAIKDFMAHIRWSQERNVG